MKTCQYIAAKNAINRKLPITQETYDDLVAIRNQFHKKVSKLTTEGNIAQAMLFNETKMEINDMLSRAIIAESEGA